MEEAENKTKRNNRVWMLLLVIPVLAGVAMCDSDFGFKNPFARDKPEETADTLSADSANVVAEPGRTDTAAYEVAEENTPAGDSIQSWDFSSADYDEPKQWRLVVSSVEDRNDAEKMLRNLDHAGAEVKYIAYLNTYRVVYESYNDLRDAQAGYDQIRSRYPKAWLVYF